MWRRWLARPLAWRRDLVVEGRARRRGPGAERPVQARLLGCKQPADEFRGEAEDSGWLRLLDEPGYVRIRADFFPLLQPVAECSSSIAWVGVDSVFDRLAQELMEARQHPATRSVSLSPARAEPAVALPPKAAAPPALGGAAETAGGNGDDEPRVTVNLLAGTQDGVASATAARATDEWLSRARTWLQRLDPKATVPPAAQLPQSALQWEPSAAVLYVLTHGHFDPRRHVPWLSQPSAGDDHGGGAAGSTARVGPGQQPGLVSVCCATSDRRRAFHPLVYENFARQLHEPRELVVVHTGEEPSDFFLEKACADPRVIYRFFPVTREAPASPRLSDEKMGNPWDAVLVEDDPTELTYWEHGDPWSWEIQREGWTKGLKRNVAVSMARGSIIVHFDDGCLYAPSYIGRALAELAAATWSASPGKIPIGPAAGVISKWYTVGIADLDFRLVDIRKPEPLWEQYGQDARRGQEQDQYNHGFVYVFSRAAWEQQPFPDVETVGTKDSDFMKALRSQGAPVVLLDLGTQEPLAACGWHRDATCGAKDAPANINDAQVLDFFRFRGDDSRTPQAFGDMLQLVSEIAATLHARRDRYLRDLVAEHGSVHVCAYCNFAVALASNAKGQEKQISTSMQVVDGYEMTKTFAKEPMRFEVCELTKAGGAVAEGHWAQPPPGHAWLHGVYQRMALCRNCGFQLGWRFEPGGAPKECASPCCTLQARANREYCCGGCRSRGPHHHDADCDKKEAVAPRGPVTWGLITRHMRVRRKAGEDVPQDSDLRRHRETNRNFRRNDVCPAGHKLSCFCTGQGNGGTLPFYYTCDVCDRNARGSQHLWGCGTCDYDMCERCRAQRV